MRESSIEKQFAEAVKKRGGLCWKFTSPGTVGVPDRIVLLGGRAAFVEVKAPGKQPTKLQLHRAEQIRAQNIPVFTLDHPDKIQEVLHAIQTS